MIIAPTYAQLPERFYEILPTVDFSQHSILYWNEALAKELGLTDQVFHSSVQLAQAYSGHQFGHYSPQLGDGRARLVGELQDYKGQWHEVHLKGSGPTRFSRRGDGLATLDAVLRELLVSEGMFALGIPTTRTLAVLGTGSKVYREQEHPGAIQVRIARSHVRVGTFEYFASRGDNEAIQMLADHVINRLYPKAKAAENPYISLFENVIDRQSQLIAQWLQVGFIHGVMNTDNTAIFGETIDFGPCAFMEQYDPQKVFSSIDHQGRYAYARQPQIILWNLTVLGYCLLPLFDENREKAEELLESKIAACEDLFQSAWREGMGRKLGIENATSEDVPLIQKFLTLLHQHKIDFTLGFRTIGEKSDLFAAADFEHWIRKWKTRVAKSTVDRNTLNPLIIPRNHLVDQALKAASQQNDFSRVHRLLVALKDPFSDKLEFRDLQKPALPEEQVSATFCGT